MNETVTISTRTFIKYDSLLCVVDMIMNKTVFVDLREFENTYNMPCYDESEFEVSDNLDPISEMSESAKEVAKRLNIPMNTSINKAYEIFKLAFPDRSSDLWD